MTPESPDDDLILEVEQERTVRTQWTATNRRTRTALTRAIDEARTQIDLRLGRHRTTNIDVRYWPTPDGLAAADTHNIPLPDDLRAFITAHPNGYLVLATAETDGGRGETS